MIEINLARQLQQPAIRGNGVSHRSHGWICAVLSLGIGIGSWWWTQIHEQEYEALLAEKQVQTQSLATLQTTLGRLEQYQEKRQLLSDAFDVIHAKNLGKSQPMALLNGVSRSIDGLEIWLVRVQMIDQVVELQGQSLASNDIGKYIDALENHQVITSLPVVEILEQQDNKNGKVFSFMIRFIFGQQVTT